MGIHGRFKGTVEVTETGLKVNGLDISLSATRDPTEIPWGDVGVDYVCESTGAFTTTEGCMKHVEGGAKLVSWYDNEWGYSTRLVDLVGTMAVKDGIAVKEAGTVYFTARDTPK